VGGCTNDLRESGNLLCYWRRAAVVVVHKWNEIEIEEMSPCRKPRRARAWEHAKCKSGGRYDSRILKETTSTIAGHGVANDMVYR
jgi:hypothetical protein